MRQISSVAAILCAVLLAAAAASAQSSKQDVDLTAADGVKFKATYYSAGKPGPGVLLMHQCNRERKTWDALATRLSQAGIHVVTFDYRGFGESGGPRFDTATSEQRAEVVKSWPGDIDMVFAYLLAQPGVDRARIGAGGASCGVDNSIQLARRHSEVKTLVLLSGTTDDAGIEYLESAYAVPILGSASEDDDDALPMMRWLIAFTPNPADKLVLYKAAGHGTEMFKVEKGLEPMIFEWYQAKLEHPAAADPPKLAVKRPASVEFWNALIEPGGVPRATRIFEEDRKKDPNVILFPEAAVNVLGYQRMQAGDTKSAIEILKINALAYPNSANVYDSLGDAYLADHQDSLALQHSEKALKILAENPPPDPARAQAIRESAEAKIKQLRPKGGN
ncbi:MAG TPA: alpha/beta hydrolase [Candidatus Limnocylindrales bacterium]|nr:alpha/beta hydrolase [Candidatus Limnocylindrales bacterium]